jgi:hypothetical protein
MPIADASKLSNAPSKGRPRRGVTLPERVTVSRFWKNRQHDAIVTELSTYEGRNVVDVRQYVMQAGKLVPTTRGISLVVLRLPELAKAVNRALKQAKELGLLPDDGASS